jgi:hypothetical protein
MKSGVYRAFTLWAIALTCPPSIRMATRFLSIQCEEGPSGTNPEGPRIGLLAYERSG